MQLLRGRNTGLAAGLQVILQTASLFLVYRIVSQSAGVEAMGFWATNVAVMWFLAFADFGMTDLLVREVSMAAARSDWARIKGLYRSVSLIVALLTGIFGAVTAAVVAAVWSQIPVYGGTVTTYIFVISAAAVVWLNLLLASCNGLLESFGRYDIKVAGALLGGIASVTVTMWASFQLPDISIALGLLAAGASNLLVAATSVAAILGRLPGGASIPNKRDIIEMMRSGLKIRVAALAGNGLEPASRIMLLHFGGPLLAGYYELAYRLVFQIRTLLVSVTQVMVPRMSRQRAVGVYLPEALVANLTTLAFRIAALLIWPTLLVLPVLSIVILQSQQPQIALYGLFLAFAWYVNFIVTPAYFANFVEGRLRQNLFAHITMLLCVIALGVPAGLIFGGVGVVAATSASICIGSLAVLLNRKNAFAPLHPRSLRQDQLQVVAGIAASTVVWKIFSDKPTEAAALVDTALVTIAYFAVAGRKLVVLFRNYLHALAA